MSRSILWRISRLVDIRGHDAIEVAPADDDAHCYAALIDSFGIIGRPDDCVCDAGVDTQGTEEGTGVSDTGRCSI